MLTLAVFYNILRTLIIIAVSRNINYITIIYHMHTVMNTKSRVQLDNAIRTHKIHLRLDTYHRCMWFCRLIDIIICVLINIVIFNVKQ